MLLLLLLLTKNKDGESLSIVFDREPCNYRHVKFRRGMFNFYYELIFTNAYKIITYENN